MISHRLQGLNTIHLIVQAAAALFLFWVCKFVFFTLNPVDPFFYQRYGIYSMILAGSFLIDLGRTKTGKRDLLHLDLVRNHQISLRQTLTVLGALLVFLVAAKDVAISRAFLLAFTPLLYLTLLGTNATLPALLARFLFYRRCDRASAILLGSPENARKLIPWLKRKSHYGLDTLGLVTYGPALEAKSALPVLGEFAELEALLRANRPAQLILLDLPMSPDEIVRVGDLCDKLGVRLFIVNDLEDKLQRSILFVEDDGCHFLAFRQEPLESPIGRITKRLFDMLISFPIVFGVLPFVNLAVWLLQRRQSPGPLFFRQTRTGKNNREFQIWKYRTMHGTPADETQQATANDPRIFPAGRWLRKLSIDELPQFINVLNGEMSVVGPRPHLMNHDVLFGEIAQYYRVRSFIKPGITGLAQVRGLRGEARKDQDIVDRIHSDLYYLEHWSLLLDWVIIFKTAWQMIFPPKTAY